MNDYNIPFPEVKYIGGNLDYYLNKEQQFKIDQEFYERFGTVFGTFIGDEVNIFVVDLELLKKIFFDKSSCFKLRTIPFLHTPITSSILMTTYDRWKIMRKVMSPYFSSYQMRGETSVQFIEDTVKLMLDYIDQQLKDGKSRLDIQDLMKATALKLISDMAIKLPEVEVKENEKHVKSLDEFLAVADKGVVIWAIKYPLISTVLDFLSKHFEYDKTMALIHRVLNIKIDKQLRENKPTSGSMECLIDVLIRLHQEGKITREEVIANADAILFAGYDTTSTTLTYVFWILGKYPDVQERLRQDLMTCGTESQYLEQVLNETMRLYPTITSFTTRLATETVKIDENLTIPQGAKVVYHSWLTHRNPKFWIEPDKFDPERFRPGVEIHPCAFAPFGLGDRKCLGYQLAKLEMKMVTCDIILRYRVKLISPLELDLISYATVITKPKEKVVIELEKIY